MPYHTYFVLLLAQHRDRGAHAHDPLPLPPQDAGQKTLLLRLQQQCHFPFKPPHAVRRLHQVVRGHLRNHLFIFV